LVDSLDLNLNDEPLGTPHFADKNIKSFPLTSERFRGIEAIDSDRKAAFIDGGNQEIVGAPNFSIQLNRVCFGIWQGNEKIVESCLPKRTDFLSATSAVFQNQEIYFETTIFPFDENGIAVPPDTDLSFNSMHSSLKALGNQRADIHRMPSIARRFSELLLAKGVVEQELSSGDLLVIDGTLQAVFPGENKYMRSLSQIAETNGVIVSGFSKTSTLLTDTGLSLIGALEQLASMTGISEEWYYPLAESARTRHGAVIFAVKLNSLSERIFRFEIQRDQIESLSETEVNEIFTLLVKNAGDLTLPGYPYGLLDVDRCARVSSYDVDYYYSIICSLMADQGKWDKFNRNIKAADVHQLINRLG